jgi:hypothetical protein
MKPTRKQMDEMVAAAVLLGVALTGLVVVLVVGVTIIFYTAR